jgi:hypothetical protein
MPISAFFDTELFLSDALAAVWKSRYSMRRSNNRPAGVGEFFY